MANEWSMRKRLAGDALDQLRGGKTLAGMMDFLVQPGLQRLEFTTGKLRGQAAQIVIGLLEELRGVEIPQGVGGKVANERCRPVNVLQAAVGVRCWFDSQILL